VTESDPSIDVDCEAVPVDEDSFDGAVFIDRDGVINVNRPDYVKTVDELVLLPDALNALARLRESGLRSIVISNQAGVGRGLISPRELQRINDRLLGEISAHGGCITRIYYCTHRKEENCSCRKPEIGLLLRAKEELDIDLHRSYLIGDALSDIESGKRAGCRTILVLSGRSGLNEVADWGSQPDHIAGTLADAVDWILNDGRSS
jgi:histidinol-phosphate phosphatase family protein